MLKKIILFVLSFIIFSNLLISQETGTPAESRKKNIKKLLDYRYRGGYYSFERLFLKSVSYPEVAKKNCVIGIMIARFEVDCEGEIKNLVISNPLRWGIDGMVEEFFRATSGNWNKCEDDKYTRFEVPIQFTINDTETNSTDAMLIYQAELIGYNCKSDSYFKEKYDKAIAKNSKKKAIKYINYLIKRNPYTTEFYDMRKEVMEPKKKK
jgi:hypothetical protein